MYLILVLNAIFHPKKTCSKIFCQHPNLKSHMIDAGMDKRYWCSDCGMAGNLLQGWLV